MTDTVIMSYKGFEAEVNPSSIELVMQREAATEKTLFSHAITSQKQERPSVIRGSGIICKGDAQRKAFELSTLFKSSGSAYLFLPVIAPVRVYFTKLKITADKNDGTLKYDFEFTEDCGSKKRYNAFNYTYAKAGENLFDIANRTGVSAEKLARLNDFKNLFSVKEGDRVWLVQR